MIHSLETRRLISPRPVTAADTPWGDRLRATDGERAVNLLLVLLVVLTAVNNLGFLRGLIDLYRGAAA